MTVRRMLLAVSPDQALDRQLAGESPAALRRFPSILAATTSSPPVYPFVHTCDPDLGRAWLRAATRRTAGEIAALPPAEQLRAVTEAWDAFGRAFQAFNLRPYGWARLRQRCEWAWGGVPPGDNPRAPSSIAYWQGRLLDESDGPDTAMPGVWGGTWRDWSYRVSGHVGVRNLSRLSAAQVIFGGEDDWSIDHVGCVPTDPGQIPDACFAPTGEVHRVWLQGDGSLSGSKDYDEAEIARQFSYGTHTGWARFAAEDSIPAIGSNRLYFLPPLAWYWHLLFGQVPGLRLPGITSREQGQGLGGVPGLEFRPQVTPDDLSLAEYLLALDPLDVVREVCRDVVMRNATMAAKKGIRDASRVRQLIEQAGVELADAEEESNRTFQQITTAGFSIAGTLTAINPFAGLIAGAVTAAAAVIYKLSDTTTRRIDVFGRLMPTYEALAYTDDETQFRARLEEIGTPEGYASLAPILGALVLPATLTVAVDAPGALVAVNGPGESNAAFPAPWGPRSVTPGVPLTIHVQVPGRAPLTQAVNLLPRERRVLNIAGDALALVTRPQPVLAPEAGGSAWPWVAGAVALAAAGGVGWWAWRRAHPRANPRPRRRRRR